MALLLPCMCQIFQEPCMTSNRLRTQKSARGWYPLHQIPLWLCPDAGA